MNEYKNRRQLLCLAVTAGMMFTAVNVSSKTVWAAAEQVIEYDPNQEEKTHPGSIILKQNLKEEDLPSLKQPEASYTDENGIYYRLADWEVRELPEASRSRMLEKTEVYREVEGAETLPPYVDSRQEENGAKISGRLYMQESRVLGEEWREDFQAPVTFYSYGADEYELGGIKISGEDILDSALAEQELLLGEMGLSSEAYHITSMDWDGESFMDETGQVCRRASARGERLLRDYEAVYRGQVQVVEPVSYEVSAVYEPAELGNISNSEKEQEEALVLEPEATEEPDPFLRWIRTGVTVTAALGVSGILLGIVLYFTGKNRRKSQEEELKYN